MEVTPKYLTEAQAEIYTGLRDLAERRSRRKGGPVYIKATPGRSGRVLYDRDDLDAWMAERKRVSTSDHSARQAMAEAHAEADAA